MALTSVWLREFRAHSAYEVVLYDHLTAAEQRVLPGPDADPDLYGVLRPLRPGLSMKSVSRDAALLLLTLRAPSRLPHYLRGVLGEGAEGVIAQLVLDGLLEMREGERFVTGPAAQPFLCGEPARAAGALARLSRAAIEYADALDSDDYQSLWLRLYFYNRVPASARWRRRFPNPSVLADHLNHAPFGLTAALLEREWAPVAPAPDNDRWRIWRGRAAPPSERLPYKLYLSPACSHLRETFQAAVPVLAEAGAPRFKIGSDVYGMLRPDKWVVYLRSMEEVLRLSERLTRELGGVPAHGAPFTAELAGDGLLSWGMDPPPGTAGAHAPSWRVWVAQRLASALLAARRSGDSDLDRAGFAMNRLSLDGVDIQSWTPVATIFQ